MFSVLIVTREKKSAAELRQRLGREGLTCAIEDDATRLVERLVEDTPDLLLVDTGDLKANLAAWETALKNSHLKLPPLIALITRAGLNGLLADAVIDDFLVKPYDPDELAARVRRLLKRAKGVDLGETIRAGDLVVDLARYEVSVNGRPVELVFREYELLRFLMANRGRVFSRQALLNKVWGYDYFGGDRTVDVHIRRLRSKIEDAKHTFIDTVRNIGYRFRRDS
ncbi:MAG: response regulator transcription factor [Dehalococcoidales bacterium]